MTFHHEMRFHLPSGLGAGRNYGSTLDIMGVGNIATIFWSYCFEAKRLYTSLPATVTEENILIKLMMYEIKTSFIYQFRTIAILSIGKYFRKNYLKRKYLKILCGNVFLDENCILSILQSSKLNRYILIGGFG